MKELNIIISFLLCFNLSIMAQKKDISGHYVHPQYSYSIDIEGDRFIYIEKQNPTIAFYSNDTLARCTWEWVDKEFIKIKSESPVIKAFASLNIEQHSDSTCQDSITLIFHIPYDRGVLYIRIYDDKHKIHEFSCYANNNSVKLPIDIKKFSFEIRPKDLLSHTVDGKFYGIMHFDSFTKFEVKNGMNVIELYIPDMTNSFFEQYYVVDDFVRVKNNRICWKGEVFRK